MNVDDLGRRAGAELRGHAAADPTELLGSEALVRQAGHRRSARRVTASFLAVASLAGAITIAASLEGNGGATERVAANQGASTPARHGDCLGSDSSIDTAIAEEPSDGTAVSSARSRCSTSTAPSSSTDPPPPTTGSALPRCDVGAPTTFYFRRGECVLPVTTTTSAGVTSTSTSTPTSSTTIPPPAPLPVLLTVSGSVTAGPACPGPLACPDKGIVATIVFTRIDDNAELLVERQVTSDASGSYRIGLTAGRYSVTVSSAAAMMCDSTEVEVRADTTLDLSCDTGMR